MRRVRRPRPAGVYHGLFDAEPLRPDTPATLGEQLEIIRRDAVVRVKPYGYDHDGAARLRRTGRFRRLAPEVVGFRTMAAACSRRN